MTQEKSFEELFPKLKNAGNYYGCENCFSLANDGSLISKEDIKENCLDIQRVIKVIDKKINIIEKALICLCFPDFDKKGKIESQKDANIRLKKHGKAEFALKQFYELKKELELE